MNIKQSQMDMILMMHITALSSSPQLRTKESLFAIGNLKGGGGTRVPGKSFEIEKQTLQCALNPPKCIHR
jgi:hypothetical protein